MTICNSLHPRDNVDRLYIPRKQGGSGLVSVQESVYMEEQSLSRYADVSEEELLAATRRENILNDWNGEDNKQLKCDRNCPSRPHSKYNDFLLVS